MHRGSSKGAAGRPTAPESLPLSASPPTIQLEVATGRTGRAEMVVRLVVPRGTLVRAVLRQLGRSPEGCAVVLSGRRVPLDTPLVRDGRLDVVPTFSGG
jgi:sulfur carrier protein ThiS